LLHDITFKLTHCLTIVTKFGNCSSFTPAISWCINIIDKASVAKLKCIKFFIMQNAPMGMSMVPSEIKCKAYLYVDRKVGSHLRYSMQTNNWQAIGLGQATWGRWQSMNDWCQYNTAIRCYISMQKDALDNRSNTRHKIYSRECVGMGQTKR